MKVWRRVELDTNDLAIHGEDVLSRTSPCRSTTLSSEELQRQLVLPLERFDPFLRHGNRISESIGDSEEEETKERDKTPDEILVADHIFGDSIYSNDFWFTKS